MTPEAFEGKFLIKSNGIGDSITVTFYRRESESKTLDQFIDSIDLENIGWDSPSRQLFYRDCNGVLYKINFEEVLRES
jgi:hypothetical protein